MLQLETPLPCSMRPYNATPEPAPYALASLSAVDQIRVGPLDGLQVKKGALFGTTPLRLLCGSAINPTCGQHTYTYERTMTR